MPKLLTIKTSLIGDTWGKINHLNGMINISKSDIHKRKTQRHISKCIQSSSPTEQGEIWEADRWRELKDVLLIKKGQGEACCPLHPAPGAALRAGTAGRSQGGQGLPLLEMAVWYWLCEFRTATTSLWGPRKTGIRMPSVTILLDSVHSQGPVDNGCDPLWGGALPAHCLQGQLLSCFLFSTASINLWDDSLSCFLICLLSV